MNILIMSSGEDTGGVGIGIKRAFDKVDPSWSVRFVRRADNFIHYPPDIHWAAGDTRTERVVKRLFEEADVVHVMEKWGTIEDMPGFEDKPKVIHHHGTHFRQNPNASLVAARERNAIQLAATIDLYLTAPDDLELLPAPYDLDWLAGIREDYLNYNGPIKIAHAPTKRVGKSTGPFANAYAKLAENNNVSVDIIEGASWMECIGRKAVIDVYFDQVLTGYGNNAIECWAMGIPVIAGADYEQSVARGHPVPKGTLEFMEKRWGELPFYNANEDTIYDALVAMMHPSTRLEYGERGNRHVHKYHSQQAVVGQLKDVYMRAAR